MTLLRRFLDSGVFWMGLLFAVSFAALVGIVAAVYAIDHHGPLDCYSSIQPGHPYLGSDSHLEPHETCVPKGD